MSKRRRAVVTIAVMLSLFLVAIEATVVSTAMPTVISELGGLAVYSWVFSIYMLASTATMPIYGKLSDLYGRRAIFTFGMVLFLAGSVLSGLSRSMTELIIFRAVQGLGSGAIMPLAFIIIGHIFSLEERAKMQGLLSSVWGIAGLIGPLTGGFLVDNVSWRAVFFVAVPPGLLAITLVLLALKPLPRQRQRPPVDYLGAALLMSGLISLLYGLLQGGAGGNWGDPIIISAFALAGVLLAAFLWVETRVPEPILPLNLFRSRLFSVAMGHGVLSGFAMFATISFMPLFMQGVVGTTATGAGMALTPIIMGWVTSSAVSGFLLLRFGYRPLAIAGMLSLTASMAMLTLAGTETTQLTAILRVIPGGIGMGLTIPVFLAVVQSRVPREQLGVATSTLQFGRSIGGAIGVSVMGAVLAARLTEQLARMPGGDQLNGINAQALLDRSGELALPAESLAPLREALAYGLQGAFLVGLIAALIGLVVVLFTPRGHASQLVAERQAEEQVQQGKPAVTRS